VKVQVIKKKDCEFCGGKGRVKIQGEYIVCPNAIELTKYYQANIQPQFYDFDIENVKDDLQVELQTLSGKTKETTFQEIYQKFTSIIEKNYQTGNGMYIYGENENGKSTLAHLIAKYVVNETDHDVYCYSFSNLVRKYQTSWSGDPDEQHRVKKNLENNFSEKDFIILDDLLYQGQNSRWIRKLFSGLIELRAQKNLPIIYTSNYSIIEAGKKFDNGSESGQNGMSFTSKLTKTIGVIVKFERQMLRMENTNDYTEENYMA
jgi:DNA replication protein DnaC